MQTLKRTTLSMVTLGLAVASPLGLAQSSSASPTTSHATTSAPHKATDAKPVEDLQAAAQRLRDAIHAMAQAPAGPQRNQAIRDGNRALMEVNEAMANLPPDMLTAQADESKYKQSIDRLQQAAQKLRDATHALAADPYSTRRNETIKDINRALADTQQVMVDVPLSAWNHSQASASTR
jgi:ABC-type transporter Mla subunit MlaD